MAKTIESSGTAVRPDVSSLSPQDLHLFNEGRHYRAYNKLGAHLTDAGDEAGVCFSVWAPNARQVSVIGKLQPLGPGGTSAAGSRELRRVGGVCPRSG